MCVWIVVISLSCVVAWCVWILVCQCYGVMIAELLIRNSILVVLV